MRLSAALAVALCACLCVCILASPIASRPHAGRVFDGHVHLTNISRFNYTWGVPTLPQQCPCAPPCLCDWTFADYQAAVAGAEVAPSRIIFIEVAVQPYQWFEEAEWVQSLASSGAVPISAMVAQPPPGFGTEALSLPALKAALTQLTALPIVHGIRLGGACLCECETECVYARCLKRGCVCPSVCM